MEKKQLSTVHCPLSTETFPPIIETERLILRPRREEDAADIFEYASDPEVSRFVQFETHTSIDAAVKWIEDSIKQYEARACYDYAIVLKENGKVIGSGGVQSTARFPHHCEIGYAIGRKYWGNGYAPEAMRAVCDFLFRNHLVHRIEAYHFLGNEKSGRVMQKIGMTYEGTHKDRFFSKGEYVTAKCFAIINPYEKN